MIPKRSFLTEYSCRIAPACYPKLMRHWFDAMSDWGWTWIVVRPGLPHHPLPRRRRAAREALHFQTKPQTRREFWPFWPRTARHASSVTPTADLRKEQQNDEILRFVEFWKKRTGKLPEELIFDSKLTTYANLDELNRQGIQFITLRRRTTKLVHGDRPAAESAWRRIELEGVSRDLQDAADSRSADHPDATTTARFGKSP